MPDEWNAAEVGPGWRRSVGDEIWRRVPRTWLPEYDSDARSQLDQALSRLCDGMTRYGELPLSSCRRDGTISLRRMSTAELGDRGDRRYSSESLARFLREHPELDLVPIVVGGRTGVPWVLDGHHRMRAYALADRPALAFATTVTSGTGRIRYSSSS